MASNDSHDIDGNDPDRRLRDRSDNGGNAFLPFLTSIQSFKRNRDLWEAAAGLPRQTLRAAGGGIMILNAEKQEFFVPAASVENAQIEALFKSLRFCAGKEPFHHLFPSGATSIINDFKEPPPVFQQMDVHVRTYTSSRLDVALRIKGEIIGTLWAINPQEGYFDSQATDLMGALAGVIGMAMERIRIDAQLSVSDRQVQDFNLAKTHVVHHLSHAIKTPLAVSIASLKLLEKHLRKISDTKWLRIYLRAERNLERLLTIEYEMEDILRENEPSRDECTSFLSGDDHSTEPEETPGIAVQRSVARSSDFSKK